jgi:hypothetical protein
MSSLTGSHLAILFWPITLYNLSMRNNDDGYPLFLQFASQRAWDSLYSHYEPICKDMCWLWAGRINAGGYPEYQWQWHNIRYPILIPRLFLYINTDKLFPQARHQCHLFGVPDNPKCVNPFHLIGGSAQDNAFDKPLPRSGHHNVTWEERTKKWKVQHTVNHKREFIGRFDTPEQGWIALLQFCESHGLPLP